MKKWVKSRNGQQTIVILSFMIIPLLLLFVFTYLRFVDMVKFSFYKMNLATILSFKTKFGNMFKGFMFFPYLISGIAIGFIFKFFYTRGFVFDTVLQWCGFNLESLPFCLKD